MLLTFAIRPTEYALVPGSITAHQPPPCEQPSSFMWEEKHRLFIWKINAAGLWSFLMNRSRSYYIMGFLLQMRIIDIILTHLTCWSWFGSFLSELREIRGHVAMDWCFIHLLINLRISFHFFGVQFFNHNSDVHQPQTNSSNNFGCNCHPLLLLVLNPLHHWFEDERLRRCTKVISAEKAD